MKKRILVTGAAGFIGSHLTKRLQQSQFDVIGWDTFSEYYSSAYKYARIREMGVDHLIRTVDIESPGLPALMSELAPEIVVHLAAQPGVRAAREDATPYIKTNQWGFLNVLESATQAKVANVIYASSSSVYGEEAAMPLCESAATGTPRNLYAVSKLSNELVANLLCNNFQSIIGLRFFTVYGPWGRPDMLIQRLMASLVCNSGIEIFGNLEVKRDATYVDDVIANIMQMICHPIINDGPKHLVLNIGGGNPVEMKDLVDSVCSMAGRTPKYIARDSDPFDARSTEACTHLINSLGLNVPQVTVEQGLRNTWDWIEQYSAEQIKDWFRMGGEC